MEIQKEREAFEQALVNQKNVSINNLHVCTIFDAEKNKYSPSDVCDPKDDFIVDWINSSWSIWQAAKVQAVPEWISVGDSLPPANILVLGMSQTRSNIFNIYNVMALDEFEEADVTHWMPLPDAPQEPAND